MRHNQPWAGVKEIATKTRTLLPQLKDTNSLGPWDYVVELPESAGSQHKTASDFKINSRLRFLRGK